MAAYLDYSLVVWMVDQWVVLEDETTVDQRDHLKVALMAHFLVVNWAASMVDVKAALTVAK